MRTEGPWYALNVKYAKALSKRSEFVPTAFYASSIDRLDRLRDLLETVSNRRPNLLQLLDAKVRITMDSKQTARSMVMNPFQLFVDPNLKGGVKAAASLNQKRIDRVIDSPQETFFPG